MKWLGKLLNRGTPSPGGNATVLSQVVSETNRWRESYNPLRGLTISRAISLFEAYRRGEFSDPVWTMVHIEAIDPDMIALIERRTSAICQLDFNFKRVDANEYGPAFSQALADDQVAVLRAAYEKIDNLSDAIEHMELAAFRGFAHLQPQYKADDDSAVVAFLGANHFECLDQWNWLRDGLYGGWYWNPDAKIATARTLGDAFRIDPKDFILHEVKRPIGPIALLKKTRENLSEKNWDAFVEIYGIPAATIIGPPDLSDPKQMQQFREAAAKVAAGGSGVLPHGSTIDRAESVRGISPFKERLDHLTQKLVLAGTGGMLTMLAQSGSGTLAGGAHQETFEIIARARARKISQVLNRQFDRRVLEEKFPGRPALAYFELAYKEEQDIGEIFDHAVKASSAGYVIEQEDLQERTGYRLRPKPEAAVPGQVPGPMFNRAQPVGAGGADLDAYLAEARMSLADAEHAALEAAAKPLLDIYRAAEAESWTPERLAKELTALQARLPEILGKMAPDDGRAKALAEIMGGAFALGVEAEAKAGGQK